MTNEDVQVRWCFILYCFLVFVLLKNSPSFKIGQDTLHFLHLKHPGSSLGCGLVGSTFFNPQTVFFRFLGCLHPTWMLSPISFASSFFNNTFLDSLIHFCTGGLDWLWVNTSLTLLSDFFFGLLLRMSSLVLFLAWQIFFLIRVSG